MSELISDNHRYIEHGVLYTEIKNSSDGSKFILQSDFKSSVELFVGRMQFQFNKLYYIYNREANFFHCKTVPTVQIFTDSTRSKRIRISIYITINTRVFSSRIRATRL